MQIARAFESERVEHAVRVGVVFGVMLELANVGNLCSFAMPAFVTKARGCSHKITEVGVEGVVEEGDEDIRAEAGCWASSSIESVAYDGGRFLERVVVVYPRGRFGMGIGEDEGDVGIRVIAYD